MRAKPLSRLPRRVRWDKPAWAGAVLAEEAGEARMLARRIGRLLPMENYQQALQDKFGYMVISSAEERAIGQPIDFLNSHAGPYQTQVVVIAETNADDYKAQRLCVGASWTTADIEYESKRRHYRVVAE